MKHWKSKVKLTVLSAVLSAVTLILFHKPFFEYVCNNVESGVNGHVIVGSLVVIMLAANFFASYLLLYLGRIVGKIIIALSFIGNAVTYYFIKTFDVIIDDSMMGNVFNTNYAEATSYWSLSALAYLLFYGLLPAVLILVVKIDYGSAKRFFTNIGISLGIIVAIAFGNMPNWTWIDKNSTIIGSLLLPWSYTVNSVRYLNEQLENNREEILLPDASVQNDEKSVVLLIIGESARRDHFSLYGYERETNPLLSATTNLKIYKANSATTYTTGSVKAILDSQESDKLYEILPNYLYRNGVADVIWRSSNWGQPPLHIEKYSDRQGDYDGNLLDGLKDSIEASGKNKVLVVLHTSTSHGPSYNDQYPSEFEKFKPISTSVEMSKCPREQLINSYDNTILYTDWLIYNGIGILKKLDGWKTCLIYVSDHGESLGENNLYMHGVPISIAPKEQYEIPFIVWTSDNEMKMKEMDTVTQYSVFPSTLHFLGISSPACRSELDLFE